MEPLRFSDLTPERVLDLTSLTIEEFEELVPRFEKEFQFTMSEWRFDGKPRTRRRYSTYRNWPLPAPEDRLLFILMYLKGHPVQTIHGQMFSLPLGKTNMWIHVLMPVLDHMLKNLGLSPSRSIEQLKERLEVSMQPPLFAMMGPRDRSKDPRILRNKDSITVERRSAIR